MTVAKTVLANGVTILSEYIPHLRSATVGVWVSVGSRAESPPDNGIGHFIEHMLFKGTARRHALDISREIESVGGTMNAYTDREFIFFFGKVLTKDFPLVADLLSDIYLHSLFDGQELDREKGVVLQEILMVEDSPEDLMHDFFHESYWGGHPLGLPIQGTSGSVAAFTRERVTEYFRDRFWRRGVIVSVVGNVPHERVVGEFERVMGLLRLGERHVPDPPPFPQRGVFCKERPIEQLHLCLGAPAVSRASEEKYAAHILNAILGGSMSSRLFQEIREKRGLAYSVFSSLSSYADTGILKICAGTTPDKGRDVLGVTGEILADLAAGRIREEEIVLAKELIKGSMLLSMESAEFRMTRLAVHEMFLGRLEEPEEEIRKLDAVTPDRLRDLAATMLPRERFSLAAVGDLADAASFSF
ncbi:MAG TPA: pitrilysin family protein [Candidatus Deferrimicrobiaceae bacterium]|nr:pitrilysin family protein [Candidatus Deferrimicrobiaceae bacterium]